MSILERKVTAKLNARQSLTRAKKYGKLEERERFIRSCLPSRKRIWETEEVSNKVAFDLTEENIVYIAKRARGVINVMAKMLGLSRFAAVRLIDKFPNVQQEIADQRENLVDIAECKLFENMNAGSAWAIKDVLFTLGKNRGYRYEDRPDQRKGQILEAIDKLVQDALAEGKSES